MLVISQKKGEKLRIGRDITITILESKAFSSPRPARSALASRRPKSLR